MAGEARTLSMKDDAGKMRDENAPTRGVLLLVFVLAA